MISKSYGDKKSTFYNSYVNGLTTFFLQHSANRRTQKNFDAFKLKLFLLLVKIITASQIVRISHSNP